MAIDLIFSFDSEDYETPAADEGELWWADALTRHGLTGCFCLVGEEARALRERGRRDVLAALARHEIAYHSNLHSAHPVHAEYLESMGWDDGVAAVMAREARGIADLRDLTGQQPSAYCKPGSSWGPQVPAAMALLGVPVFCDAPFEWAPGLPLWYCGSLCLKYHISFDRYFKAPDRQVRMRHDFQTLLDQRRESGGAIVMYTHPCRLITADFPANFRGGRNLPRSAWQPAPLRERGEVTQLMADFDDFLTWVVKETDTRPITYRALMDRHRDQKRWLDPVGLELLLRKAGGPLESCRADGSWLSPAEQLGVLLWAATWLRQHDRLPDAIPVRPLLGPDDLPMSAPAGDVDRTRLLDAAAYASQQASDTGRIPAAISLGDRLVGPGALRGALAQALTGAAERVRVGGLDELPMLAGRQDFAELHFRNTWSTFATEFEAPHLIRLAQIQTWSAKPAN